MDAVSHIPLMQTTFIDPQILDINSYDFLIITSKRALQSLFHFNYNLKNIDLFCVGEKTAKFARENELDVVHTSSGYSHDLISEIQDLIKGKHGLYLRPKRVANAFILDVIQSAIVYETLCLSTKAELIQPATLLFAAPSQIECFMKNFSFDDKDKVVVIGKTTAQALPKDVKYHLASEKSLESLYEKAKSV